MIDKITPRGLDKSSDHKLVSKSSMIDAVNVYIADDYVNAKQQFQQMKKRELVQNTTTREEKQTLD